MISPRFRTRYEVSFLTLAPGALAGLTLMSVLLATVTEAAATRGRSSDSVTGPISAACTDGFPRAIRATASSPKVQVAISSCGKLVVSKNGKPWRQAQPELRTFFRDVIFADGRFVAVGGSCVDLPGVIMTCTDGEDWRIQRCGAKMVLQGVTHGNGVFVVVGDDGMILTSKNGADWKAQAKVFEGTLASVAFGAGTFVAVGDDGVALVSSDASHWTRQATGTSLYLAKVSFTAGQFLAGGRLLTLESTDGLAWSVASPGTNLVKQYSRMTERK